MIARLIECSDYKHTYGILEVKDVSIDKVDDKICEIKGRFEEEGFDEWCIEDVLNEFPDEWEWGYWDGDYAIAI